MSLFGHAGGFPFTHPHETELMTSGERHYKGDSDHGESWMIYKGGQFFDCYIKAKKYMLEKPKKRNYH